MMNSTNYYGEVVDACQVKDRDLADSADTWCEGSKESLPNGDCGHKLDSGCEA